MEVHREGEQGCSIGTWHTQGNEEAELLGVLMSIYN